MRGDDVYVRGLGAHLPEPVTVEQAVAEGHLDPEDIADGELTGVRVAGDTPAPELALRAARQLFERTGIDPTVAGLLVYSSVWHQGPDGWGPQSYVQRHLGGDALAIELRHGCTGVFSALKLAAGYLRGNEDVSDALLLGGENFGTPLIDRWRATGGGMLVGDGASALLLGKEPGFAKLLWVDCIAVPELEGMHRAGEPLFPPGATTGRELNFSARNLRFLQEHGELMRPLLMKAHQDLYDRWTNATGLGVDDVTYLSYMNTSRTTIEKRLLPLLGLPAEKTTWEIGRDIGHLGVSDQLVALDQLLLDGRLKPGDHYLMYGLGPGMTVAGAMFEITEVPSWT
ncbi:3-oxoacyl-ACP synthase [Streptomyces sp. 3MP-14]|uniref:3-oxoacyl-ACP synthase n=1 Tax=Streptomyces mimosae TaxID=2586635 RepID=A0A5N6ANU9_9ACTN|nr:MULTISPECIES: ketoacyl-ACP synthase III family protein [Streptomyces]KAB8169905.1 3-oxoacyl-ACP synthase [Streptomyces mimosae]KAB8178653.1 3-oxoacyl-ACP synthase [Streptomyces sp. 3MP-14]